MVEFPAISVPTAIVAVLLSFLLSIVERRWAHRRNERRETKRWYERLSQLAKEVKFTATSNRGMLEFWETRSTQASDTLTEQQLDEVRDRLESLDLEDPDEYLDAITTRTLLENIEATQYDLKSDSKMLVAMIREHLAKYPDDVDIRLLEAVGELLRVLNAMGVTGQITKEVEDGIWEKADVVISECNKASTEYSRWFT